MESDNVQYIPEACCDNQNIESIHGLYLCLSCGQTKGPDFKNEFIDFYTNMYRIRKKSIYNRKYHIQNVLILLIAKHNISMTRKTIKKICKIFDIIDNARIVTNRKRMISIKFILRKLFQKMELPFEVIPISKSKKTNRYYLNYWIQVEKAVGDKIRALLS